MSVKPVMLLEDESIISKKGYTHWVVVIWPLIFFFLSVYLYRLDSILTLLLFVSLFFFIISFFWACTRLSSMKLIVTNKRLMTKSGWIKQCSKAFFLNKIDCIEVRQTLLGKLLGYGTVVLMGSGGYEAHYSLVNRPAQVCKLIQQHTEPLFIKQA